MVLQLRQATPVARKPHKCDWCYTWIHPGQKYHRSTNIYDDRLYDWVSCEPCEAICVAVWDWAYRPDEGIGEDSFDEWARAYRDDETHGEQARSYLSRREQATSAPTEEAQA